MRVGFLVNQIDNRGTGNASFDYAHYNEVILGNESVIFTFSGGNHENIAIKRYKKRFKDIYYADFGIPTNVLDVLYHVKSGEKDGYIAPSGTRYAVHAVFNGTQKHGDRYAAISEWLGKRDAIPYVNHIVTLPSVTSDLREFLNIPSNAVVFGRHGGFNTFDVSFAWSAISKALDIRDDLYFVFLNTNNGVKHPRIFYLDQVATPEEKRAFINTCDAMIHARERGETFGIAVGEFSICGKTVLTYGQSREWAHIEARSCLYTNEEELIDFLVNLPRSTFPSKYLEYTPENIMKQFKEQFLD